MRPWTSIVDVEPRGVNQELVLILQWIFTHSDPFREETLHPVLWRSTSETWMASGEPDHLRLHNRLGLWALLLLCQA